MTKKSMKKTNKLLLAIVVVAILLIIAIAGVIKNGNPTSDVENTEDGVLENTMEINLGNELYFVDMGGYTGPYVEDGSDEVVSDVLMARIENRSKEAVEYAVIQVPLENEVAEFTVSALMPGAKAILLEKNRMTYDADIDYTNVQAVLVNYAKYQYELALHEDKINIQLLDGAVNVTNISEEDISENITIYYKNKDEECYLGGIAYRITLEGGIAKDEVRQMMANHISATNSEVLFVTMTE